MLINFPLPPPPVEPPLKKYAYLGPSHSFPFEPRRSRAMRGAPSVRPSVQRSRKCQSLEINELLCSFPRFLSNIAAAAAAFAVAAAVSRELIRKCVFPEKTREGGKGGGGNNGYWINVFSFWLRGKEEKEEEEKEELLRFSPLPSSKEGSRV